MMRSDPSDNPANSRTAHFLNLQNTRSHYFCSPESSEGLAYLYENNVERTRSPLAHIVVNAIKHVTQINCRLADTEQSQDRRNKQAWPLPTRHRLTSPT
jgi:hypothetical protein